MIDKRLAVIKLPKKNVKWENLKDEFLKYDRVILDKNTSNLRNPNMVKIIPCVKVPFQEFCNLLGLLSTIEHPLAKGIQSCKGSKIMKHQTLEKLIKAVDTGEIKIKISKIFREVYNEYV